MGQKYLLQLTANQDVGGGEIDVFEFFFLNRFYEHRLRSLQELTFHEKGPLIRMWEEDINAMNFFNNQLKVSRSRNKIVEP